VVGVHVAEPERVEFAQVTGALEGGEGTAPSFYPDTGVRRGHEIARARLVRARIGRSCSQDRECWRWHISVLLHVGEATCQLPDLER
jgi:hypothetical protein